MKHAKSHPEVSFGVSAYHLPKLWNIWFPRVNSKQTFSPTIFPLVPVPLLLKLSRVILTVGLFITWLFLIPLLVTTVYTKDKNIVNNKNLYNCVLSNLGNDWVTQFWRATTLVKAISQVQCGSKRDFCLLSLSQIGQHEVVLRVNCSVPGTMCSPICDI